MLPGENRQRQGRPQNTEVAKRLLIYPPKRKNAGHLKSRQKRHPHHDAPRQKPGKKNGGKKNLACALKAKIGIYTKRTNGHFHNITKSGDRPMPAGWMPKKIKPRVKIR